MTRDWTNREAGSVSGAERQGHETDPTLLSDDLGPLTTRRPRLAVGPDVTVSGHLAFTEPVRIEGRFRGEVSSAHLVVVESKGSVEGNIRAPRLIVLGELRGNVTGAREVVVGPLAKVSGRIAAASLRIYEGALVNGDLDIIPETITL
jgi:cytoskeletal protein CcmA (bactofilin family)